MKSSQSLNYVLQAFLRANLAGSFVMFGWRWGWDIWEDSVIGMRKKCRLETELS